jgi:curved DNA-binding protein CbpA
LACKFVTWQARDVGDGEATHYERLGADQLASQAEIRAAYRNLARRNHPDLANGSADGDIVAVNEAWRVLGDAERRAAYDATLPPFPSEDAEPVVEDRAPITIDADDDDDDWRLDLPITDGRAVRTFGIMVAVTSVLALAAVIALFAYAILWAG